VVPPLRCDLRRRSGHAAHRFRHQLCRVVIGGACLRGLALRLVHTSSTPPDIQAPHVRPESDRDPVTGNDCLVLDLVGVDHLRADDTDLSRAISRPHIVWSNGRSPHSRRSCTDLRSALSASSSELPETTHHGFKRRRFTTMRERVCLSTASACATSFEDDSVHGMATGVMVCYFRRRRAWSDHSSPPVSALRGATGDVLEGNGLYHSASAMARATLQATDKAGRAVPFLVQSL